MDAMGVAVPALEEPNATISHVSPANRTVKEKSVAMTPAETVVEIAQQAGNVRILPAYYVSPNAMKKPAAPMDVEAFAVNAKATNSARGVFARRVSRIAKESNVAPMVAVEHAGFAWAPNNASRENASEPRTPARG